MRARRRTHWGGLIGAGIAGPALGIALRRAGIEAIVYEASDRPRDDAGAFLNVAPNGLSVLQALGVSRRLEGLGFQNDRLVFHNETGRVLAEVPVGGVTLMRGALSRVVREVAEEAGVRFEFGKALSSVTEDEGNVAAHFADGTTADGSSLVGADGIHSRTRYSYFADAPKPTYTGIINLGGIVRTDLPPTGTAMHMIFGRRGFFGYAVRPGGETYWFSNFAQKEEPSREALLNARSNRYRQQLLAVHQRPAGGDADPAGSIGRHRRLAGVRHPVAAVVASRCGLSAWRCRACHRPARRARCFARARGRVRAGQVSAGHSRASRAFSAFEHLRRGRVEPIVKQSRRTGQQKAPAGWLGRDP